MDDPVVKLAPNRHKALKVYKQQLKRLSKNPEDRKAILKAEKRLQDMGFMAYVKYLPDEIQKMLRDSKIQNFLPWRISWKDSLSTPVRPVFDGRMVTDSGYSINDIVAKGTNNMNKLVEMFIRWRGHTVAFHSDIQKMYNAIKLDPSHWCLQRYLWEENLDPEKEPVEKVIKTLIYGVKSSGNQAERGIRLTAEMYATEYPEVSEIVHKDTYMDDILSGAATSGEALRFTDELELVLNFGGFTFKGFTVSGRDPDEALTKDGCQYQCHWPSLVFKRRYVPFGCERAQLCKETRRKEDATHPYRPRKVDSENVYVKSNRSIRYIRYVGTNTCYNESRSS